MLATIYKFELEYWIKNPLVYVFIAVLFGLPFLTMWGMSAEANTGDNLVMMNSYYKINNMANMFALMLVFLLPAIVGNSIFRDYSSRMYTVLYSFPFSKKDYLVAKFGSAMTVVFVIISLMAIGFLLGSLMPGVKEEAMLPLDIGNYLQLIFVFLLPNMFFFGVVVLALTLFTRNIYVSFIGVIFMIIIQSFGKGVLAANGFDMMAALADPTGEASIKYIVRYWTLEERNYNILPLNGAILYNRMFWLAISIILMIWTYMKFEFNQFVSSSSGKAKRSLHKDFENKVSFITVPEVSKDHSFRHQLRTTWHLSNIDFKSIISSWPFISILFAGGVLVLFQQYKMGPLEGVVGIPTTSNMLRFPMFFFSAIVNLLTFLYAGVLMYKGQMSRMNGLINSTPTPNWVMLASKLLALIKMQFVLLLLVLVGGVIAQIVAGYYRFELWHYLFELYVLQGVHFFAWACLAICIHSIAKNLYLGYFVLILIPVFNLLLPMVADYLDWDVLKESLFQFNAVKDIFIGFDYSEFNGYGGQLTTYFAYKFYWMLCSVGLVIIALLFWKRGKTFTLSERWKLVKSRSKGIVAYSLGLGFIAFVGTGFAIYHQEHTVSKIMFSDQDVKNISAENEIRYGHLEHTVQPRLVDAKMTMDIYPDSKNFNAKATFTYVNKVDYKIDTIVISKSLKEVTVCKVQQPHTLLSSDDFMNYDVLLLDKGLTLGDSLIIEVNVSNHPNTLMHHNSRVISDGTYMTYQIMPVLGIRDAFLTKEKDRKKYGLGGRETRILVPSDSSLLGYEFAQNNQGLINYECTMSTSEDQTPFTMGTVQRKWKENGRNFVHYKAKQPIANTMSWMSGNYEKVSAEGKHQALEMYRHPKQDYNDPHFFHGLNTSLDYCSDWFGRLPYDTMRIVEFPETQGTFATVTGNLIPYSEVYFKCDVHDHENDVFNIPFFVSAHEIAHCWWGHSVDPANIPGGKIITEGMADYIAMKSIEQEYDVDKVLEFRKRYHKIYLEERASHSNETALIHSTLNNEYLNYRKASLAIYAMSEHIGENVLNTALAKFEKQFQHTEPPYPTSLDFVECIREATPDSLGYLVYDMFETITLYDNKLTSVSIKDEGNQSIIDIQLEISKYRSDEKGKRTYGDQPLIDGNKQSLPLADYIEIGFFNSNDELLEKTAVKVSTINSSHLIKVKGDVNRIEMDPNHLLFAVNRDNYRWED